MSYSEVIRREFKISDEERDEGLTTPCDVVRYDDIFYAQENFLGEETDSQLYKWHLLDVYRPKSAGDDILPVIVNVHGGGWVYGDKDVYQYYCMDLCRRGYAVVNFSYRLAPEYKFPAQLEDTNMAFKWVLDNADQYGFDTDRIYAVGDSAGANILGLYCAMCTNEEYAGKYDFKVPCRNTDDTLSDNFVPRAIGLNCGEYEISPANMRDMKGFMRELMPNKGTLEELEQICVTKYINKDFPPTFFMTCYGDFLKDQAPLLGNKLKEAGVPYVSRLYGSEEHPLKHVFNCDIRMDEAKMCNDETCEFFERYE